jgi:hypothetical protein
VTRFCSHDDDEEEEEDISVNLTSVCEIVHTHGVFVTIFRKPGLFYTRYFRKTHDVA